MFGREERRAAPRIKGTVVEYCEQRDGNYEGTAFMKDISLNGLGISLDREVSPKTQLYFKIYFPGKNQAIEAGGVVIWQKKAGFLNYFDTGIELNDVDSANLQKIEDYINQALEDNS